MQLANKYLKMNEAKIKPSKALVARVVKLDTARTKNKRELGLTDVETKRDRAELAINAMNNSIGVKKNPKTNNFDIPVINDFFKVGITLSEAKEHLVITDDNPDSPEYIKAVQKALK